MVVLSKSLSTEMLISKALCLGAFTHFKFSIPLSKKWLIRTLPYSLQPKTNTLPVRVHTYISVNLQSDGLKSEDPTYMLISDFLKLRQLLLHLILQLMCMQVMAKVFP